MILVVFLYPQAELGMVDFVKMVKCIATFLALYKTLALGYRQVVIEGDCLNVIFLLRDDISSCLMNVKNIILDCRGLATKFLDISFSWEKRSRNVSTHLLANHSLLSKSIFSWTLNPPTWLDDSLNIVFGSVLGPFQYFSSYK